VKLSWNGVGGASGYQIYHSASQNGAYAIVATTSNTSYAKAGLKKGNDYYKVRAYRKVGNTKIYSAYTNINLKAS